MVLRPYNDPEGVGRRLRLVRIERGYGVRELARLAEVHPGKISWLEGGRAKQIGLEIVAKLADALEIPRAWLAWGEGTAGGHRESEVIS